GVRHDAVLSHGRHRGELRADRGEDWRGRGGGNRTGPRRLRQSRPIGRRDRGTPRSASAKTLVGEGCANGRAKSDLDAVLTLPLADATERLMQMANPAASLRDVLERVMQGRYAAGPGMLVAASVLARSDVRTALLQAAYDL